MNLLPSYVVALLVTSVTFVTMGIFVLLKNRRSLLNRTFFLHFVSIAIWSLFEGLGIFVPNKDLALLLWRVNHIGVIFIPIFLIHFIFSLLDINKSKKKVLFTIYSIGIIFLILDATDLFISDVVPKFSFRYFIEPGIIYSVFFFLWITAAIYGHYELYKAYSSSSGARRNQLKYHFWGLMVAYIGGTPNFLPTFYIEIYPINPFGTYGIIIYALILTYAMAKYRLMDINIAFKNLLVHVTEIAVLSIFLFLTLGAFGFRKIPPMIFTSFGIAIGIIPLRAGIIRFVDRIILKGRYNYQQSLAEITNIIPTIIDKGRLIKYIVDNVTKNMHIGKAILFLKDELKDRYLGQYSVGLNIDSDDTAIDGACSLIKYIKEHKDIVLKYELYQIMPPSMAEELWNALKPFDTELIIPFKKGEDLIGLFCLSHKEGGDIFNQYDLNILQSIANQVMVTLENINLYHKIEHSKRMTSIGMMASSLAHEIKNPLVPIKTYIQNLPNYLNEADKNNEFIKKVITVIPKEVDKISTLLNQMRDFANPPKLNLTPTNLHKLIDGRLGFLSNEFSQKKIKIAKTYYPHPINTKTDPIQLERVFTNIFLNAINAMPKGGNLSITTEIGTNQLVLIKITDTGIGIEKEDLPHIFEPFFSKGEHKGSGLGLAISHQITKEHNGTIQVESSVDKGTTFLIYLPRIS